MLKKVALKNFFILILIIVCSNVYGQNPTEEKEEEGEFLFEVAPSKKDAQFTSEDKISYDVKVHNPFNVVQEGTVSFKLTTLQDVEIATNSVKVSFGKRSSGKTTLNIPSQTKPGFYKLAIMINVTEYDDTIKKVFGVNVKQIRSETPAPKDFDEFWRSTRKELRDIKPEFKMTLQPALTKGEMQVYLVEAKSLDNITVRGWLTMSKKRKPKEKLPVWLVFPGYGVTGIKPIFGTRDLAVLTFNFRGEGNSRDKIRPTTDGYITHDIEHRKKYILRGAIMDCIRSVDFICSRPELDSTNIICSGGSLGGYFSLITCSLDKRVRLVSSYNPPFSDWRALKGSTEWPMSALVTYSKNKFIPLSRILDNLDYYDLKNFTPRLSAQALIGISLLDNLAPPFNQYSMINNIKSEEQYKLYVFPNLTHEVPQSLYGYLSGWMMDEFGLF